MRRLIVLCFAFAVTACSGSGNAPVTPAANLLPAAPLRETAERATGNAAQKVYWALFAPNPGPQLQIADEPLMHGSSVKTVNGTTGNLLQETSTVRIHQDLAWVLTQPNGPSAPSILLIFSLPIATASRPLYYDTLEGALVGVHIEFDGHGNLWVSSVGKNSVYEYTGNFFQEGGDFKPALTLTAGIDNPQGLAFDPNGNLYVANAGATNIAVFAQPISNQQPYFLKGITNPGGIAFDSLGNLFASSNNGSTNAIVKYASNDLRAGKKPTVVDATGIAPHAFGSDLAFDKAGNLYDGDCGDFAGIYTYPLASKKFTSKLAPTFYTNTKITNVGCVWGLAVH